MSVFDALSRIPKILEANVNAAVHYDPKAKPAEIKACGGETIQNGKRSDLKGTDTVTPSGDKAGEAVYRPKPVSAAALSDLEKELIESSMEKNTDKERSTL